MSELRISEAAERSGFPATTLRYYEQLGLVSPRRSAAGYRVYDDGALDRLAFIARALQLGATLDEIAELVTVWDGRECAPLQDRLRELVAVNIERAQTRAVESLRFGAELARAQEQLAGHRPAGPCDESCGCVGETATAVGSQPVRVLRRAVPSDPPIVCALETGEVPARKSAWQALLGRVERCDATDGELRLRFGPEVSATDIATLVSAELRCCAFFTFTMTMDAHGTGLEVRAPQGAADLIAEFLAVPV